MTTPRDDWPISREISFGRRVLFSWQKWGNTTVHSWNYDVTFGIVACWSRRSPDLEPSIAGEIAYSWHGTTIPVNQRLNYLFLATTWKMTIRDHHQMLLLDATWPLLAAYGSGSLAQRACDSIRGDDKKRVYAHVTLFEGPEALSTGCPGTCRGRRRISHWKWKLRFVSRKLRYLPEKLSF